jgi:hypothetical protein
MFVQHIFMAAVANKNDLELYGILLSFLLKKTTFC